MLEKKREKFVFENLLNTNCIIFKSSTFLLCPGVVFSHGMHSYPCARKKPKHTAT